MYKRQTLPGPEKKVARPSLVQDLNRTFFKYEASTTTYMYEFKMLMFIARDRWVSVIIISEIGGDVLVWIQFVEPFVSVCLHFSTLF